MQHYARSRNSHHIQVVKGDGTCNHYLTAADSLRLSSWLVSASKVFDHIMLVARLIIDDKCTTRDNHLTSLISFSGSKKQL